MKKLLAVLFIAFSITTLSSSSISSPVATVNLIRNTAITEKDLENAVETYRQAGITAKPSEILQTLINDEVFLQGAERDGVVISDRQLDVLYSQSYQSFANQALAQGVSISREDFDQQVIAEFGSVDEYKNVLKNQQILNSYLFLKYGDEIQNVPYPTEAEISTFYRINQQQFFQPECVKLSHIFISKDTPNAVSKINEAYNNIKNGRMTYEAAVPVYSEDTASINSAGEIGWLVANNTIIRSYWGNDIVDKILSMKAGEISEVLESNVGYHIVKVSVHLDAKLLSLTDPITPENTETIHDYIYAGLYQQNVQIKMAELLNDAIAELRSEARIRILYTGE